jgi:glycosyltransferase involved in cell wall biosynthesis
MQHRIAVAGERRVDSESGIGNGRGVGGPAAVPDAAPAGEPEVSVVIPCLNEAQSLGICIDKCRAAFHQAGIHGEVIVADNGSTDGSIAIAAQHGARVAAVAAKGYGSALRGGIALARGRFIILGDADDSYDFSELPRFVVKWREGFDLVMGNRLRGKIQPGAMPWHHRYLGTPALSLLAHLLFGAAIGDVNCGMRGFTRDLYDRLGLRTTGMEFASELVIKAAKNGARIGEIPIALWPDKRGRAPHLRSFRDGWRHLRFMLLYAPNWLFLIPGGALFLLGVAMLLWLVPGPRRLGRIEVDVHTMLFGMTFALTGAQIIAIGLFAKVFSFTELFARRQHSLERWLRRVRLEEGLIAGALLVLIGAAGALAVLWKWVASGFGPMHDVRVVIFFAFWFLLGIQVIFSSFFLSMLGISRDTYVGDYDKR